MQAYCDAIANYANFTGRTNRSGYWFYQLQMLIIMIIAITIDSLLLWPMRVPALFSLLFSVFSVIPSIAITVRRLHDIGWNGAFVLLVFIPFGGLFLTILMCFRSREDQEFNYRIGV